MDYLNNWRLFSGICLTETNIEKLPACLEKEHILMVRNQLVEEGFNPDEFRVTELPIEGYYYFEKDLSTPGVDYFGVAMDKENVMRPIYTTITIDENGNNTYACTTISESMRLTEC